MVSPLSPIDFGQPQQEPNLMDSYLSGRNSFQKSQINDQAIQQNQQQISQADYEKAVQKLTTIGRLASKAREYKTIEERQQFAASLSPEMLKSVGIPPESIKNVPLDDKSLDSLIAQANATLPQTKSVGDAASFNELTKNLSPEDRDKALKMHLGFVPKAQGSAAITIANQNLTDKVGDSEASIIGKKKTAENAADIRDKPIIAGEEAKAKAGVELATRPAITTAVDTAANNADAASKAKVTAQKNATALAVYESGIASVKGALENTTTGPIAGKFPAMSAEQQTAEGSIAAMAPVLKGLFREAGEGTFTKEDQDSLMAMLPTRKDLPAAREAKLKNVDALVKLKLSGQPPSAVPPSQGSATKKLTYDPATGTFH